MAMAMTSAAAAPAGPLTGARFVGVPFTAPSTFEKSGFFEFISRPASW